VGAVFFDDPNGEAADDSLKPIAVGGVESIDLLGQLSHPIVLGAEMVGDHLAIEAPRPTSLATPVVVGGVSEGEGVLKIEDSSDHDALLDQITVKARAVTAIETGAPASDDYQDGGEAADLALWSGSAAFVGIRLLAGDRTRLVDTGLAPTSTAGGLSPESTRWDLIHLSATGAPRFGRVDLMLSDRTPLFFGYAVVTGIDDIEWVQTTWAHIAPETPPSMPVSEDPTRTLCFRAIASGRTVRGVQFSADTSGVPVPETFPASERNCFTISRSLQRGATSSLLTVTAGGRSKAFAVAI
jgi:hypothetical protein